MEYSYRIWNPGGWYEQTSQDGFTSPQLSSDFQKHLGEVSIIGNFSGNHVWCCNKTGSSEVLALVNHLPPGCTPFCCAYTKAQMQDLCNYRGSSIEYYNESTELWTVSLTDYNNPENSAPTYATEDSSRADAYATVFLKAVEAENGSSDDEPYGAA